VLDRMEQSSPVALSDRKKFWKDQLFDFGFAPRVIEIAVSYEFRWGDIIPDLFIGKFGPQNQHFSDALPPYFCEQTLKRLLALALHEGSDRTLLDQLEASLKADRVEVTWAESTKQDSAQASGERVSKQNGWPTATQREILKQVITHFLKTSKPTSRILLVKKFGDPDIVDDLAPVILRNPTGDKLFPTALAFQCCGDANYLKLAHEAVKCTIIVLQRLFKSNGDKLQFSMGDLNEEMDVSRKEFLGPVPAKYFPKDGLGFILTEPEWLQLGLYLIQDFHPIHSGMRGRYPNIFSVVVNERIDSKNAQTAWSEHVEQYDAYLTSRGEKSAAPQEGLREPETTAQPVDSGGGDQMQPAKVLNEAIKAVPAVKYALGIGGVIAVIAIIKGFGIDYKVAGFGAVIMLVLMTMLVIFAKLTAKPDSDFHLPAVIFTWFALVLTMATAVLLFTSVFLGKPLDLQYGKTNQGSFGDLGPADTLTQYEPFGELRRDEYESNDGSQESEDKAKHKVEQRLSHYPDQALVKEADAFCQNLYALVTQWNQEQKEAGSDLGKGLASDFKNILVYSHRSWPEVWALRTVLVPKIPPGMVEQINVKYSSGVSLADETGLNKAKDVESVRQYLKALRDAFVASR
jgi:hypothetical protein